MKTIKLKLDATFGVTKKIKDKVNSGEEIGIDSETHKPVTSPISGIVEQIILKPQEHYFEVILEGE